jgi:arylsulfatase A-like enzyme
MALLEPGAGRFWRGMQEAEAKRPGSWREAVRHYQAAATFADAQIGRLIDALESTPRSRTTVVVLWSDHGYQLGEKGAWEKFTLWEKATHVPLLIVAPGVTTAGTKCVTPVSLLDLYPTLAELTGVVAPAGLEGESLVPLLRHPAATRTRPAVMTYLRGNHAVRNERWRYIRYANGDEELYDHTTDSHEWTNLAARPEFASVKTELARSLPRYDAPAARDMPRPRRKQ